MAKVLIVDDRTSDALLSAFAQQLKAHNRGSDIACRWGGEEFVLAMPEAREFVVSRRAEQIGKIIRSMAVRFQGEPLPGVTVSAGVAVFSGHGDSIETIIRAADEALYRAKLDGRDRFVVAQTGA